ncbi:MAG: PIN domain-containing protein [Verrucomicrobia bacterium]|nr:PIN domain-containing protein [Verrucomicrobiota bacterium]
MYLIRLSLFVVLMYLGAVIALRGRDEFNLVIPYVRFVPHGVDVPLVVVDTSALIDARIVGICESRFMGYALVIPQFVVDELQRIADSDDPIRKAKGRKGLETLNKLREMRHVDLRINDSQVDSSRKVDAKLIFLAQSLKAKLLTTDYNLAQVAEFNNIEWLNITLLGKALSQDIAVGSILSVDLVKTGKEPEQAVGYLADGSMVVVPDGKKWIGKSVDVEVQSILPSSGGKLVFAKLTGSGSL